ncbi:hypothetical protein FOA52_009009 [Chlamydomonas sp. UWO 241]|nr:hypothetical protein FOA52_009009 [Chlamydomonas sp. UWO 241]
MASASEADGSTPYAVVEADALYFRPPTLEDLPSIHALESAGYPPDEAAPEASLRMRIEECGQLFLCAVSGGGGGVDEIVGYVCATCTAAPKLTHESMSTHDPDGTLLCIHSVCVAEGQRCKGIATRTLGAYLNFVCATSPQLTQIRLLSKENMLKLYTGVGFTLLGPSDVVHGAETWYELSYDLAEEDGAVQEEGGAPEEGA